MTITRNALIPVWMIRTSATGPTLEPSVSVLAGLFAIFAAFWNLHVVLLLTLTVAAGVVDLLVGARRAHLQEASGEDAFTREKLDRGMVGKIILLVVSFFIGMCVDSVFSLVGSVADLGFAIPFATYTPITAAALFYRLGREVASIMRNIEATPGGKDGLWPPLKKVLDIVRFRMSHPDAVSQPNRRWDDELSPEEKEMVKALLAERRKGDEP